MTSINGLCLLILLTGVLSIPPVAEAKCMPAAGPMLSTSEKTVEPGGKISVTGKYFVGVCNDVAINGIRRPHVPAKDVVIYLVQGNRRQEVARIDANEKNEISAVVTIPADAVAGTATLLAEFKAEAGYAVKVQPALLTISAR
jgi:hypothetical protein